MRSRLLALPLCALVLATVDTLATRGEQWHRSLDATLPLQALALWFAFGLLALIPASLTAPLLRRIRPCKSEPAWVRDALGLFAWMALPVALHSVLDRHTGIYSNLSAFAGPRPWLEAAAVFALISLGLWGTSKLLARLKGSAVMLIVSVVSLVALVLFPLRAERFGPSPAAAEDAPNLLLLIWDTTRATSLADYGYDRDTTPHLAEFAQRSVLFEEARSVAVYTLTSHVTMLTGVYPSHHGARLARMRFSPDKTPSIARELRNRGYRTGAFVGTGVLAAKSGIVDGFEVYDDLVDPAVCDTAAWSLIHDVQSILVRISPSTFNRNGDPHGIQDFQRPADDVLKRAARWIESDDPRPWFCMVNLYDVHWPYLPSEGARERWVEEYSGDITGHLFRADNYDDRDNGGVHGSLLNASDNRHLEELYDAELWELDAKVAAFLERADVDSGNVGVVLTADHGEAFGEGGRYEHADVLEPQVRIPFLVRPPVGHAGEALVGTRVAGKVSGVDVAPTLLGLAGIEGLSPRGEAEEDQRKFTGKDLLAEVPTDQRPALVEDRDQANPRLVRIAYYRDQWKFVRNGLGEDATRSLFDLSTDKTGLIDVSGAHSDLCRELEAELDQLRATWGANDEEDAKHTELSNMDALEGLGYVGTREEEGKSEETEDN